MEIWKDVVDWEDLYEVSNLGNVRSKDRVTIGKDSKVYHFKGKNIKKQYNVDKYHCVPMKQSGIKPFAFLTVHRLVAKAFIPNTYNKETVNHKDFNKTNNKLENLEWATRLEQELHKLTKLRK